MCVVARYMFTFFHAKFDAKEISHWRKRDLMCDESKKCSTETILLDVGMVYGLIENNIIWNCDEEMMMEKKMEIKLKRKEKHEFHFIRWLRCMSHAHSAWYHHRTHSTTANSKVNDNNTKITHITLCLRCTNNSNGWFAAGASTFVYLIGFFILYFAFVCLFVCSYDMRAIEHSECNLTIAKK